MATTGAQRILFISSLQIRKMRPQSCAAGLRNLPIEKKQCLEAFERALTVRRISDFLLFIEDAFLR